jgi:hypothetical protein
MDLLKQLFKQKQKQNQKLPQELVDIIFAYAGIETVIEIKNNYLFKKIYEKKIHTMEWAIMNGHLETIKWLYNKNIRIEKKLKPNSLSRLFYIDNEGYQCLKVSMNGDQCEVSMNGSMDLAAKYGHLEVVKWLYKKGERFTPKSLDSAIKDGHLEVVKWLYKKGERFTPKSLDSAIKDGNLENLKLIYNKYRGSVTIDHMSYAAKFNHLEVLKWLWDHGGTIKEQTISYAIENKNLLMLKFLLTKDSTFRAYAINFANTYDHLEVIEFLQTQ